MAAVRVFLFSAAFPFFNNVDELRHFNLAATAIAIVITVAEFFANGVPLPALQLVSHVSAQDRHSVNWFLSLSS
jgi:hypothetical protein